MKWWPCMMKRKCEPEPHLKLFRLSWDKARQEKVSALVRYFSYFWCRILRGCGVCDAFAVLLSEPVAQWLSRGDLKPSILLFPAAGHCLSCLGRAGPQELSGLVLVPGLGFLFLQPGACGLPSCSSGLASARSGEGWQPWGVGASQLQGQWVQKGTPPLPSMALPSHQAPQPSPDQHKWHWCLLRHKVWYGESSFCHEVPSAAIWISAAMLKSNTWITS